MKKTKNISEQISAAVAKGKDFFRRNAAQLMAATSMMAVASCESPGVAPTTPETKTTTEKVTNVITLTENIPSEIQLTVGESKKYAYPTATAAYGTPEIKVTMENPALATVNKFTNGGKDSLEVVGKALGSSKLKIDASVPAGQTPLETKTITYEEATKLYEKAVGIDKTLEQQKQDKIDAVLAKNPGTNRQSMDNLYGAFANDEFYIKILKEYGIVMTNLREMENLDGKHLAEYPETAQIFHSIEDIDDEVNNRIPKSGQLDNTAVFTLKTADRSSFVRGGHAFGKTGEFMNQGLSLRESLTKAAEIFYPEYFSVK